MLKLFHLEFTEVQLTLVSNLFELHKAHVLHHWRLVGIPMIGQEVNYVSASTVANCQLPSVQPPLSELVENPAKMAGK